MIDTLLFLAASWLSIAFIIMTLRKDFKEEKKPSETMYDDFKIF